MNEHDKTEHASAEAGHVPKVQFTELLNDAWQLFQKKFWNLLGIYLMMTVISALVLIGGLIIGGAAVLITLAVKVPAFTVLIGGVALIFALGLAFWAITWTLIAVIKYLDADDNPSVLTTIQKSKPLAWVLLPTMIINTLAILGGFILFVIPGIVLSISLGFVGIVAILENKKMWEALQASRNLVRGRWWNVFFVYLVMILLIIGVIAVTGAYTSPIALFMSPLMYTFCYLLYKRLKAHPSAKEAGSDNTWFYKLTIVLASLAIIGTIVAGAAAAGTDWNSFKENFRKGMKKERSNGMYQYRFDGSETGIPGFERGDRRMMEIDPEQLPFPLK
jgi:hypothetical protein